jgi:hypothetical protein
VTALAEEQEVERLFGLRPEAFVAARTEAARRLRREGDAAAAARVAALRRPPLSAWAVNQLARDRGRELEGLLEAGERLRAARQAALTGGGGAELRASTRAEREAAAGLVDAAVEILRSAGHPATDATRDRIAATLHAAAGDPAAAELVRGGRLTRDLDPAGFGTVDALAAGGDGAPADAGGNGRAPARRAKAKAASGGRGAARAGSEGAATAGRPGGGKATAAPARAGGGGTGGQAGRRGGGKPAAPPGEAAVAPDRARRVAAAATRDEARRRARLAADQAVLATRHAERLGRLADQAEREAERARATATAAIEAAVAARERASRAARVLAEAEDQLGGGR